MIFNFESTGGQTNDAKPAGEKRIRVKKVVLLCHFCRREPIDSCLFWTGRERRKFLGCAKCVEELKQGKKEVMVMGLKEYLALDPKKVDAWVRLRGMQPKGKGGASGRG